MFESVQAWRQHASSNMLELRYNCLIISYFIILVNHYQNKKVSVFQNRLYEVLFLFLFFVSSNIIKQHLLQMLEIPYENDYKVIITDLIFKEIL